MSLQVNPTATTVPQQQKKRGCFFYGCLTAIVISIVLIIGVFVGVRYFRNVLIDNYTQTTPMALPPLDSSTESYLRVKSRVETFQTTIRSGKAATLELTAAEINTYLASQPGLEGQTDFFRVSIDGDQLGGVVSFPFDYEGHHDRYVNGMVKLKISMKDGQLSGHVLNVQVGNNTLPQEVMSRFLGDDIFSEMSPEAKKELLEALSGVRSIVVEGGKLKLSGGGQ